MRNLLESEAYILHYRPYRDTSLLIDFFTREQGLVGAIARSVRGNKSPLKGILQPFVPLLVSLHTKRELAILTGAEPYQQAHRLVGKRLFSAFYLNELLMKLLQRHDAHPELYECYQQALIELCSGDLLETPLRRFEKRLISELGYGLNLVTEANTGEAISSELSYQFFPQKGFILMNCDENFSKTTLFSGKSLLALAEDNFSDISLMRDMKNLLRVAIADLLGQKTLKSRDLFLV